MSCIRKLATLALGLLVGLPAFASAAFTPPIGIPTPPFGTSEEARATPNPWSQTVAGFYYVDASASGATDNGNPNGWPAKPRVTIPIRLPAGAVVEVHGTYNNSHSSPDDVIASGTAAAPVFIRGQSSTTRPTFTGNFIVSGSYFIVENINFFLAASNDGGVIVTYPTTHGVIRHNDIRGHQNAGGIGLASYSASDVLANCVLWDNKIHGNGNWTSNVGDRDLHGIVVNMRVNNLWVLDNEIYENEGTGIQINASSQALQPTVHHIYVGRNVAHHNKQAGFSTKQSVDTIFSQNTAYAHRASNSADGSGLGQQYGPQRVWYLFNHIYDCENGISVVSDSGLGSGTDSYYIGNLIHNIHTTTGYQANSPWSWGTGIQLVGHKNRFVINNTIYDVDHGITGAPSGNTGSMVISNNVIAKVTRGSHIFLEASSVANASAMRNNLLEGTVRIKWGSTTTHNLASFQQAYPGQGVGSLNADPMFLNPAGGDFHPSVNSPVVDHGAVEAAYATFKTLYGIDIAVDFDRVTRPLSSVWDIGAYEVDLFKPDVTIGDATVTEGNSGITLANLTVSLSAPVPRPVYVNYQTGNATALAGADYIATAGTIVFPPGSTSQLLSVAIRGDRIYENAESLLVTLTSSVNGIIVDNQGQVTIINDDAQGFSVDDVTAVEKLTGTTVMNFTVTLAPTSAGATTVAFATVNGSATAGSDYVATSGTLSFSAGASTRTVPVTINADALREGTEVFTLRLSSPTGGAAIAAADGTGKIYDPGAFHTVAPCRLIDTRNATGPLGGPALSANSNRTFTLAGQCGIPLVASAVSLNITVTAAGSAGNLRVFPAGAALPLASVINHQPGLTRANNVLASLNASGQLAIRCDQAAGTTVHVIVDVNGYTE